MTFQPRWLAHPVAKAMAASVLIFAWCSPAIAEDPSQPGSLRYEVYSHTAAELFWDRSSDDVIVVGYEIQINDDTLGPLDALSYFSDTLTDGTTYNVAVTAIDNEGNRSTQATVSFVGGERGDSPSTTPSTDNEPTEPADGELAAPTGLRADVYSAQTIEVFWDRVQDAALTYEISLDGELFEINNGTSAYINTLQQGQTVEFSVVAIDADNTRSPAATVVATTRGGTEPTIPPEVDGKPPAPQNASLIVYSSTAAELFWDRPPQESGVVSTQVYRDNALIGSTDGISFFDNTRSPDVAYQYELFAQNAAGVASTATVINEGGTDPGEPGEPGDPGDPGDPVIPGVTVFTPLASDIVDVESFYDEDGYDTVDLLRVDVKTATTPGVCIVDDYSGCTLADVLTDINPNDDFKPEIKVHFQSDDFPDDGSVSNAELRQRGGSSRLAPQKSFRIKLDSDDVLWRNEDRLQLNKNPNDPARIRNKLAFDLMQTLPHLPSLRTQFVHLWIDDGDGPVDQGMYTHAEYVGKEYLVNRGRDKDENVYKIEYFEFSQADLNHMQLDENGAPLDDDEFEKSLDPKRGEDHRKVVEMIKAVNDPNQSFESVFDKYFNRNNVLMWVTANFLLHQTDAITHNFYLYNPADSDKFYFLPWDYDGTFDPELVLTNSYDNDELQKRLFYGYARGINSNFVSQYYRLPGIHEKILAAADEIRNTWLTDSIISESAQRYADVVEPLLTSSPDVDYRSYDPYRPAGFARHVASVHESMRTAFDIPMPPTLQKEVTLRNDKVVFAWTPAYDVTRANSFTYELDVSTSVAFEAGSIVLSVQGIAEAADLIEYEADASSLPSGTLYYRVTARSTADPDRVWQVAENFEQIDGKTWYGLKKFELP